MPPSNLSPAERETVITMNDEDATADIWTAQRPIITKLRKNPLAVVVEEGHYGSTAWARFTLPADRLSFLGKYTKRDLTDDQRAELAARLEKARAA